MRVGRGSPAPGNGGREALDGFLFSGKPVLEKGGFWWRLGMKKTEISEEPISRQTETKETLHSDGGNSGIRINIAL